MATFGECIADGVAQGAIDAETGHELKEMYGDAVAAAGASMSPGEADRFAGKTLVDALERAKIDKLRQQALSIRVRRDILEGIAGLKERRGYTGVEALGGKGGQPPKGGWVQGGAPPKDGPFKNGAQAAKALPKLMRNKGGLSGAPLKGSVEGRTLAVRGLFDAKMAKVMETFQSHFGFDSPNRARSQNLVREAFGEKTGDPAAHELATAWGETAELSRQMFNAAGGSIGKIDRWGMPTVHDAAAIYRQGKAAWVAKTLPRLDAGKMVDRLTGAPFTQKRLAAKLGDIFDRIVTHGLIDRPPGERTGAGMLANQRGEERFLVFKDADNWFAYQKEFGLGDPYNAMVSHLDDMASDIGRMQILGPNPDHQFDWLVRFAQREAAIEHLNGAKGAPDAARSAIKIATNMYDAFTGKSAMPVNEKLARTGATVRSYLNGADLGGAILTDMPSAPMFGAMARSFMGIKLQGDMAQLGQLLLDPGVRADARRMGFINETARDGLVSASQDSLRNLTSGEKAVSGMNVFARKLPAAVMRMEGLSGSFEARKRSFRLSFMGALADAIDKSLPELAAGAPQDRALAQELNARAFTPADWDAIRATPVWQPRPGVNFLRPQDIAASATQDLGLRVGEMVLNGEQYAVPVSSSLWTRAALLGADAPGTMMGEARRSFTMFKTFLVNAQYQYGEELFLRGLQKAGGNQLGGAAWMGTWAAGMMGCLTLSGAVTVQLKQLARGLDPLPMNTPQFWGAAAAQGGGLGLLGDFFYSAHARNDKSAPIAGAGPTGQLVSDAWDMTVGELADHLQHGQHPNAREHEPARLAHDVAAYTPGASLWWARLAFDRMIVDNLRRATDPDADAAFQRQAAAMQRERGSGAWWPAGQTTPQRGPDFAAAMGGAH
jgi:hypothetical protein